MAGSGAPVGRQKVADVPRGAPHEDPSQGHCPICVPTRVPPGTHVVCAHREFKHEPDGDVEHVVISTGPSFTPPLLNELAEHLSKER